MTPYVARPECSPRTKGLIIASTAAGDSTLAFATRPSSLPFGIEALSPSMRLTTPGSIGCSITTPVRSLKACAAAAMATARSEPALGSFDSRKAQEREAGPLCAADSFVRLHAEAE